MKTNIKSTASVFAGMATIVFLSVITDALLQQAGFYRAPGQGENNAAMLALALAYRSIYGVLGGYVTAITAPVNPMNHALILGLIGTAVSFIGVFVGWNLSGHWYPLALVISALPSVWLGARLKAGKQISGTW
ncbi:MAG: hypothetical protein V4543_00460 [Bacteroidota bacterium]